VADYAQNAKAMAGKLDVVVVLIQYRLWPFGWLRHSDLRDNVMNLVISPLAKDFFTKPYAKAVLCR
jgi:carboxylesterase type B